MEMLIALALAGLLLSILFQVFVGAAKSSTKISSNTTLVTEAQLTQQFIGFRLIESSYLYPKNTTLVLGNTALTKNYIANKQSFKIGTDPIVAGLLAPAQDESNYLFYAYYPMPRADYIAATAGGITLDPDPVNDYKTWVLVEYRQEIPATALGVAGILNSDLVGGEVYLLADYIEPSVNNPEASLDYTMFDFDTVTQSIQFRLRMLRYSKSSASCSTAIRYPQLKCSSGTLVTPVTLPLSQEIIPRNFFLGSDFN